MATRLASRRPDTNVSDIERWASIIGGGGLLAYGLIRRDKAGIGLAALGGGLLWRGSTGHCDVYQALGINTARDRWEKGTGLGTSVPYELGYRVDHTVRIAKPRAEVYRFWRNFENLPRFMQNLESVSITDDKRSRWVAKAPAGMTVSWDAEIINEIENELIGWRSLPGSQVDSGGSVRFHDVGEGATELMVSLQYNPPAGTIGQTVAKLLGDDPAEQIRTDLENFRQLMENGTVSVAHSAKKRSSKRTGKRTETDTVGNASEESFPASDAPSWTPETL